MSNKQSKKEIMSPANEEIVNSATQKLAEILVQHIDDMADESLEKIDIK